MKKKSGVLALLLIGVTLFSGCSMLTANGRNQRAYERYVRKSSLGRVKQQKRLSFHKTKLPAMPPSEPTVTTEVSGPESVSTSAGEGGQ